MIVGCSRWNTWRVESLVECKTQSRRRRKQILFLLLLFLLLLLLQRFLVPVFVLLVLLLVLVSSSYYYFSSSSSSSSSLSSSSSSSSPPPSSALPAISLGFAILGEIFAYVTVSSSNQRVSHIPSSWMVRAGGLFFCLFVCFGFVVVFLFVWGFFFCRIHQSRT